MKKVYTYNKGENYFYNNINRNRKEIYENSEQVTVDLSIDFVRFSIPYHQLNNKNFLQLFNVIRRKIICSPEYKHTKSRFYIKGSKYTIRIKNKIYVITATLPFYDSMPILLTVNDADSQVLRYLEPYLSQLHYHISQIEYTMDFFSNNKEQIYQFMLSHLLLKWPGKKYVGTNYEDTFYRNDLRGS